MKTELKETKEYRTVYIANDGTEFRDEAECRQYEGTARAVIQEMAFKCRKKTTGADDYLGSIFIPSYDDTMMFFQPEDEHDLMCLNKFLELDYDEILGKEYIGKKILVNTIGNEIYGVFTKEELLKQHTEVIEWLFADEEEE